MSDLVKQCDCGEREVSLEEIAEAVKEVCGGSIDAALEGEPSLIDEEIADELRAEKDRLGLH